MSDKSSIFDYKKPQEIYKEIQTVYLMDSRPWVIGYSGGKDSTVTLQLIWYALKDLPQEKLHKKVYVISSDTLVETPVIVDYIDNTLDKISQAAQEQKLPISTHKVQPIVDETFWVNLIGKGYPAPSTQFRWCTDRMKIKPANRFILDRITQHGEVIVVLGVRKAESATRAQVMSLHRLENSYLSRHSRFPRAFVYTPIEDFITDDVWTYLLNVASPWGNNNRDLLALYSSAASECPLVVDDTTPSCGNSRFGCWVCTVVKKDKSMEALIDHGEDWMEPLLEFRDWLAETQDPEKKHIYRTFKRRGGFLSYKEDGSLVSGPYKFDVCKDMLKRVLEIQKEIQQTGPNSDIEIIKEEELHTIRKLWRLEQQDWEDSAPKIYREVFGADLNWTKDDLGNFTLEEAKLLQEICDDQGVSTSLVKKLLDTERQLQGMNRRSSIYNRLDKVLKEEWRSDEELLNIMEKEE